MTDPIPIDVRSDRPHSGRLYDLFLGGKDNYRVDRETADDILKCWPGARSAAQANRAFMGRAIHALTRDGISQFLDIGVGIPRSPNVHEVAQQVDPAAQVVYVDNDPLVVSHARALLKSGPYGRIACLHADVTSPTSILDSPMVTQTLDLSRPVALSLGWLLHLITDDHRAREIVSNLTRPLARGSALVISHITADFADSPFEDLAPVTAQHGMPHKPRDRDAVKRLLCGYDVLAPGIVPAHLWRPEGPEPPTAGETEVCLYAAVARS
ncbi:SAM-dependent methyltransferase [Nocardia takedensis]